MAQWLSRVLFGTTRHLYIHRWSKGYQSTARSDIGKFLMGVNDCLSLLNCDVDGWENYTRVA